MPFYVKRFDRPVRADLKNGIETFIQSIMPLVMEGESERLSTSHMLSDPLRSQMLLRILVISDHVAYITDLNPVMLNAENPIYPIVADSDDSRPLLYGAVRYSEE